ncbi:hypothetical protein BSKO_10224 [Bryopsis sp. KO-2023]|nr:hypothetical protein BSKO_10224 [Bryopsis sp. KO-2023]
MGLGQSKYSDNDFELAIRAAKDLEYLLESEFGASGKGLHEKISSGSATGLIPEKLVKKMRYLATLRNQLVHQHGFNRIPNRESFIRAFETSEMELKSIVEATRRQKHGREGGGILRNVLNFFVGA